MCRDKFYKRSATFVLKMTKYLIKNQINGEICCVYELESSLQVGMPVIPKLILSFKAIPFRTQISSFYNLAIWFEYLYRSASYLISPKFKQKTKLGEVYYLI